MYFVEVILIKKKHFVVEHEKTQENKPSQFHSFRRCYNTNVNGDKNEKKKKFQRWQYLIKIQLKCTKLH